MKDNLEYVAKPDSHLERNNLQHLLDRAAEAPAGTSVHIRLEPGVYSGNFFFDGNARFQGNSGVKLWLTGTGMDETLLTGKFAATEVMDDGLKRGTFRSYTAFFSGPEVHLEGVSIENTAGFPAPVGMGRKAGQAVALYSASDTMYCRNVRLSGHQDTLFTAPLPEEEREKGGFRGPQEHAVRKPTFQLFEDCEISGTIDFIFGGAAAHFRNCRIVVRKLEDEAEDSSKEKKCFVAAPCGDYPMEPDDFTGIYIFEGCSMEREVQDKTKVYLARPWRPYGRCCFFDCRVGPGFEPELWHVWNNPKDRDTATFVFLGDEVPAGYEGDWGSRLSVQDKDTLLRKASGLLSSNAGQKF